MQKILFLKSNSKTLITAFTPPLGVMYLASYIRKYFKEPVDIRILDNRLHKFNEGKLLEYLKEFNPSIVGISCITPEAPNMHQMAGIIKCFNKDILLVVGGPHPTQFYEEVLLDKNIDVIVLNEGEETFLELLKMYTQRQSFKKIKGIVFREDSKFIRNQAREYIMRLDEMPFPAWDLIEVNAYARKYSMSIVGMRKYMVIFTSRGCPYRCIYCHNFFGSNFRARSPENVIEEIDILVKKYNIRNFEILDDIFNLDYKRAEKIMDIIIAREYKLKLSFAGGLRGDLLDYAMLYKMRKAGTIAICVAIETAVERIQVLTNKRLDVGKVQKNIGIASKLGIFTTGYFMLGFPEEKKEEMLSTIEFAFKSKLDIAMFFIVTPFQGTMIFECYKNIADKFKVPYENYNYFRSFFNLSAVSNQELINIQQKANQRFYCSFKRQVNIFKKYASFENGLYTLLHYFLVTLRLIIIRGFDKRKSKNLCLKMEINK